MSNVNWAHGGRVEQCLRLQSLMPFNEVEVSRLSADNERAMMLPMSIGNN